MKDFAFDNIFIDEKSSKNVLVYDISYKTLFGSKPLRIRFDEVDGFIRVCNEARYLTLFGSKIYNKVRYLIS